jgi:hypothetical protein
MDHRMNPRAETRWIQCRISVGRFRMWFSVAIALLCSSITSNFDVPLLKAGWRRFSRPNKQKFAFNFMLLFWIFLLLPALRLVESECTAGLTTLSIQLRNPLTVRLFFSWQFNWFFSIQCPLFPASVFWLSRQRKQRLLSWWMLIRHHCTFHSLCGSPCPNPLSFFSSKRAGGASVNVEREVAQDRAHFGVNWFSHALLARSSGLEISFIAQVLLLPLSYFLLLTSEPWLFFFPSSFSSTFRDKVNNLSRFYGTISPPLFAFGLSLLLCWSFESLCSLLFVNINLFVFSSLAQK